MAQFEFDLSEIKRENILADKIEFENVLSDLGIKEADFDLARKKDFQQFSLKLDDLSFEKRQKLLDVLKLNHYEKSLEIKGRQDRKDSRKDFKLIQRLEDQSISRAIDQEIGAYNSYEEAIRNAETVADRQRIHREAQIAFGKRGFQLPAFGQTLFSVKDLTQRKLNNEPLPEIPLSVKDAIDSGRFTENEYYQMLIAMNGGLTKEDFGDRGLSLDTPEEIAAKNKLRYNVLRQRLEGEDYKPPSRQYRRGPVYSPGTGMPGGGIASEAYLMMIEDPTNLGLFEDPEDFIDTRLERVMAQAMQGTVINEEEQD